jgi:hypothetical protein
LNLPANAKVLASGTIAGGDGRWYAVITFAVPGQGGYGQMPTDDMLRGFDTEEAAKTWLADKVGDRQIKPQARLE